MIFHKEQNAKKTFILILQQRAIWFASEDYKAELVEDEKKTAPFPNIQAEIPGVELENPHPVTSVKKPAEPDVNDEAAVAVESYETGEFSQQSAGSKEENCITDWEWQWWH